MEATQVLDKEAIYEEVMAQVQADLPDNAGEPGLCFYFAVHAIEAIRRRGVRAILQAGSCSWPRIPEELDDGVMLTHFGYTWSPTSPHSMINVARGGIPEMHVWAGIPEHDELVDFTTGRIPEHARQCGLDWPGAKPPKYLWGKPPKFVLYHPIEEAVAFVFDKVCEFWSPARALALVDHMEKR